MDPLSDVLSLLKPRSYSCAGFDVGGDYCTCIPVHDGIVCYVMLSGEISISVEGEPTAIPLRTGDCVVLPTRRSFKIGTDINRMPIEPEVAMQQGEAIGSIHYFNGGGKCFLVACHFEVDGKHAEVLLNLLSPIVHIRTDEDRAALRWTMDRMRLELHDPQPGGSLVVEHLAHLILVHALRLHLMEGGVGWLFALGNQEMSAAITAMHRDPGRRWTLDSLADEAGMSRANFALRFKAVVGASPIDYLRHWRMLLAGNRLTTTTQSVSVIAQSLGYESESAFSATFKRAMGVSPGRYGRREKDQPAKQRNAGRVPHAN
jgi:AraC-like DNA-binding protein